MKDRIFSLLIAATMLLISGCAGIQHTPGLVEAASESHTIKPEVRRQAIIPLKPKPAKSVSLVLSKDRRFLQASDHRLWGGGPEEKRWALITLKALDRHGRDLLHADPQDIGEYCANYPELDLESRRHFWAAFISSLARLESRHDPSAFYQERFNDVQGNPVVSRGLLQLSIESGNGYGCALESAQDLYNPARNLVCAVRILNRWVGQKDGIIVDRKSEQWRGAARYWSPFRNESKREQIARETTSLPMCRG